MPERALESGRVVGHFSGRMGYGPRALGARSILGDARSPGHADGFEPQDQTLRSFGRLLPRLAERVSDYFELDRESPYMLLSRPCARAGDRPDPAGVTGEGYRCHTDDMLPIVRQIRSDIPR